MHREGSGFAGPAYGGPAGLCHTRPADRRFLADPQRCLEILPSGRQFLSWVSPDPRLIFPWERLAAGEPKSRASKLPSMPPSLALGRNGAD